MFLLIFLLLNAGFIVLLFRLSSWYKLKTEAYVYHLLCLNLVMALMYMIKYLDVATELPLVVRFFASLAIVYVLLNPFSNFLHKQIRAALDKMKN